MENEKKDFRIVKSNSHRRGWEDKVYVQLWLPRFLWIFPGHWSYLDDGWGGHETFKDVDDAKNWIRCKRTGFNTNEIIEA